MADVDLDVQVDTEADDDAQRALQGLEDQMKAIQGAARGMRGTFDQMGRRLADTGRRLPGMGLRKQIGITADDLVPSFSQSSMDARFRPLVSAYDRIFGRIRGVVNRSATARGGMTGHAGAPDVSEFGSFGAKIRGKLGGVDSVLGGLIQRTVGFGGNFGSVIQGLSGPLSGLVGMLGGPAGVAGALLSIGKIAGMAFAAIATGAAMAGVAVGGLLAQQVMASAMMRERAVAAFDALVGSGEASFKRIQQLSLEMGTSVQDSFEGMQSFLAAGFKMDEAENWFKRMQDLSLIGITEETRKRIVLAMSQIKGAGQLQGDELRQLQETGINVGVIWEEIAKQMGVTVKEAKKLKEQGKVGSDVALIGIERAIAKLTGGDAGEARKKFLSSTIQGSFERLKSVAAFGISDIADKASPAWDRLRGILNEIADALGGEATQDYTKVLGEGFLAAGRAVDKAWQAIQKLATGFDDVMRKEGGLDAINELMRSMFGDSDKADLSAEAFYNIGRAAAYMTVAIVAVAAALERMIALLDQLSTYSADNPLMRALAGGTMGGEAGDLWQNSDRPLSAREWMFGQGEKTPEQQQQKVSRDQGLREGILGGLLGTSIVAPISSETMQPQQGLFGALPSITDLFVGTVNVANATINGVIQGTPELPSMPVEAPSFGGVESPLGGMDVMRGAPMLGLPPLPSPPPMLPGAAPVRPVTVPATQGLDFSGILQSITGLSGSGESGERKTEVTVNISVQGAGPNADEEWERLAPHVRREVQVAIRSAGGV